MGTGRGKKRERELERKADVATQQVQPSELEKLQEKNVLDFIKQWQSGKDVKDIDALSPHLNLFNNAKESENVEKLGGGGFNLAGKEGAKVAGLVREQNALRKEQEAAGNLYNAANTAYGYATGSIAPRLMAAHENRVFGKAQLANNRYNAYLNRPQKPNPWLMAFGQVGQAFTGG